jgi:DNA primase
LSFAALFPDERTRFASLAGRPSPAQKELVRAAISVMPASATVLSAMDADAAGRDIADLIGEAVKSSGRADVRFVIQEPEAGKDWNDLIRARSSVRSHLKGAQPV